MGKSKLWSRDEVLVALNLYCQISFGKLHKGNPLIIEVARLLERTPDALAMKLTNLASLDPQIIESGRKGLSGCSNLDRTVWAEFQGNPEEIGYESQLAMDSLVKENNDLKDLSSQVESNDVVTGFFSFNRKVNTQVRVKQSFFRKAVLSSYDNSCCMTGLSDPRLLVASHILPWSKDEHNRLNPSNGLCLSALHDKAYDRGLLTVTPDFIILVSNQLKNMSNNQFAQDYLINLNSSRIILPKKFFPSREFLDYHLTQIFLK